MASAADSPGTDHSGDESDGPPELTAAPPKVPLTILTGYLGAGKSTLLDHILNSQHGRKIAVIMNEFGSSSDIEAKAISVATEDAKVEEWLEMDNGCLCCSVRDTGMLAIQSLMQKKGRFDQILLETTGLADPGPIVQAFWNEEALCNDIVLDSVVTVVDARGIEKQLSESREEGAYNEAQRQIAIADVVLLNKVDLESPSRLLEIEASLRSINSTAVIHRTTRANLPLSAILDLNIYVEGSRSIMPSTLDPFAQEEPCRAASHEGHDHGPVRSPHANDITSVSIPLPVLGVSKNAFESVLRDLLWGGSLPSLPSSDSSATAEPSEGEFEILRSKGFLRMHDGRIWILQGVREMYELKEVPAEAAGERSIQPKLVLIGRNLASVSQRFLAALDAATNRRACEP